MSFKKVIVIDGKDHLMGRLASIVAKELLLGQKIVVVRCEDIDISGSFRKTKENFRSFLHKKHISNPKRGPIHFRAPSKIFWRTVRGMISHKTERGKAALKRLKTYEGVPYPYNKMKLVKAPKAYRPYCYAQDKPYTKLHELAVVFGWKYHNIVKKIEEKRLSEAKAYHESKKKALEEKKAVAELAMKNSEVSSRIAEIDSKLKNYGY